MTPRRVQIQMRGCSVFISGIYSDLPNTGSNQEVKMMETRIRSNERRSCAFAFKYRRGDAASLEGPNQIMNKHRKKSERQNNEIQKVAPNRIQ